MFPWSAVFSAPENVPGRRASDELVTSTLMLELGATVKRTERVRLERDVETRRRRNSASSADYSWLATSAPRPAYELTPGDLLELRQLCAQVPPPQCGPLIVRFRKQVRELDPEVHEVPRVFRTVLQDFLEEEQGAGEPQARANGWEKPRSRSLSLVTFGTKLLPLSRLRGTGGSRGNLQEESGWWEEGEEEEPDDEASAAKRRSRGRSKSMPDITPFEQPGHS